MKFYLIDDDRNILNLLKIIIKKRNLGTICGTACNGQEALEELAPAGSAISSDTDTLTPDLVIVDLLMPEMDGISFVRQAQNFLPGTAFIMLSQVTSKEMISSAYEAGVEFFIQKPLNSVEVESVIKKVTENLAMQRTMQQMQSLFHQGISASDEDIPATVPIPSPEAETHFSSRLRIVLQRLGIIGDNGSKDIITIAEYLASHQEQMESFTLHDLCSRFSDTPKSMEQRIRRTTAAGLVNLAHLGVEDYGNDIFTEYSNTLYNFEQVRKEMDFIRGKKDKGGNVKIKNFLNALVIYCLDK